MHFECFRKAAEDSRKFFRENATHLEINEETLKFINEFPTDSELLQSLYRAIMSDDEDVLIPGVREGESLEVGGDNESQSVVAFRNAITELLEHAIDLSPNDADAQILLGFHLYAFMDETDKAIEQFDQTLGTLLGQQVEVYLGLSNCFLEKGRFEKNLEFLEKAKKYCESALEIEPENEEAIQLIGDIRDEIVDRE